MENETYSVLIRTCKRCKETLPLAEFRYKLTRAQMKAQGFAGNVLVTAEGKVCKYCRPQKKPRSKLTRKELITKASSGDIHPFIAQSIIAERKKSRPEKQKAGRTAGWHKYWKAEHKRVLSGLPIEIHRVTGQARHALASRHMDRHKFFLVYLGELKRLRARLFLALREHPAEPKFNCWQEYADMDMQTLVRQAWEALPLADRVPLKVPALIRHRFDPLVNAYTRPTRASPAERIAQGG
jgi:hypothetical protein